MSKGSCAAPSPACPPRSALHDGAAPREIPPIPRPRITQPLAIRYPTEEQQQAAIASFEERARSVETVSPEELAQGERELRALLEALDRNRRDAGERPLYPE